MKLIEKLKNSPKKSVKAFTLLEMLVVLLIISVLLLLFVPNLTKQKDKVNETGNAAIVKVVDSQAELYEMNNDNGTATLSKLVAEKMITEKQQKSYNDYYTGHNASDRHVPN